MEEERDNNSKATSRKKGDSADGWAGLSTEINLSSAYATLLDQYREALARVHVLEMQNQNLASMVKRSPLPLLSQDGRESIGASETTELVARIEPVEGLLAKPVADGSGPAATEMQGSKSESRDEIAQLRIQVQSLLGQLSAVNGRPDGMKKARSRSGSRRGRSSDGSSWLNRILKR